VATPVKRLYDAIALAKEADVIGVDEGQFMPDLLAFCEEMANAGKVVIVAALDGTYERKPFKESQVLELIPRAESVTKLTAICFQCRAEAAFTRRIAGAGEEIAIGGHELYVASCRACFDKPITEEEMERHRKNVERTKLLKNSF
jgi:thymidine kinase